MGQGWNLWADGYLCVTLGKLGEGLFDGSVQDLHDHLRRPKFPATPFHVPPHTQMLDNSRFARIPDEIVGKIFEAIGQTVYEPVKYGSPDAYGSMISLCLTCSRMWGIGELECRKVLFKWGRGDLTERRLIILGDYFAETKDKVPENMFTTKEKKEITKYHFNDNEAEEGLAELRLGAKPRVWQDNTFWVAMRFDMSGGDNWNPKKKTVLGPLDLKLLQKIKEAHYPTSQGYPWIEKILFPTAQDQELVLRNLTKKEYVRESSVAVTKTDNIPGITLGTALAVRICFPDPEKGTSISRLYEGKWKGPGAFDISQGSWVLHTFDVVDKSEVQSGEGGEWKDVSGEVAREIDFVWGCEYGDEWQEMKKGNDNYAGFAPVEFS